MSLGTKVPISHLHAVRALLSYFVQFNENHHCKADALVAVLAEEIELTKGATALGLTSYWPSSDVLWVLNFGANGDTTVVVVASSLDDALEGAAEELPRGFFYELELPDNFNDLDEETQDKLREAAEEGLTYTESGYISSHEWTADDVSRETLISIADDWALRTIKAELWFYKD